MGDFIPAEEVLKNADVAPAAVPQTSFVPAEEVIKNSQEANTEKPPTVVPHDQWRATNIEYENRRLAGNQHTLPYVGAHKDNYVGDASIDDANQVFIKGDDGKLTPTDNSKHVVLQDPEDGKYKIYKRTPDTDVGPIKSRIMAASQLVQEGFATPTLPIAAPLSAAQKALQAADALKGATGVEVQIPKVAVTDSRIIKSVAKMAGHVPGGSGPLEAAKGTMAGGLESATDAAAALPTGVVGNAEEAGQAVRFGINERIKPGEEGLFNQQTKTAYDKVDSYIKDPTARSPLDNTKNTVQNIISRFNATEQEGMPASVKAVMGAVEHPEGLTYQAIKDLRTTIGENIQAGVNTGMSQGELKQIYGALSDDLKATTLAQGGKRGLAAFEKANAVAQVLARNKEKLAGIVGSESKSDEGIFNTLLRKAGSTASADAKTLALAKRSMSPSEWNEVSSGVVARLGKQGTGTDAVFSPDKFVRDFRSLSPQGKDLLFGTDGKLRTALEKISELSDEPWQGAKGMSKAPGELGHLGMLAGLFHHLGAALTAATGASVVNRILSRPATADNVAKWMQSYKLIRGTPTNANVVAYNNASRVLANDAAEEARGQIGGAASAVKNKATDIFKGLIGLNK